MTETGEYDPSEMALRIAEAQAGARYFADMAQNLRSSLTWDAERAGDLYPVMMDALNGIEDTREACERAAKALDDRADALKGEMHAHQRRKLVGFRVPEELYEDLETLRAIAYAKKSGWSLNKELNAYLETFIEQNRAKIDAFRERNRPDDTEE